MSSLKNTEKPFRKWKAPEKSCKSVNILATHWKKCLLIPSLNLNRSFVPVWCASRVQSKSTAFLNMFDFLEKTADFNLVLLKRFRKSY
jgi:hypothetical protein